VPAPVGERRGDAHPPRTSGRREPDSRSLRSTRRAHRLEGRSGEALGTVDPGPFSRPPRSCGAGARALNRQERRGRIEIRAVREFFRPFPARHESEFAILNTPRTPRSGA